MDGTLNHVKIAAVAEPRGPRAETLSAQRATASGTPLPATTARTAKRAQRAVQAAIRLRVQHLYCLQYKLLIGFALVDLRVR